MFYIIYNSYVCMYIYHLSSIYHLSINLSIYLSIILLVKFLWRTLTYPAPIITLISLFSSHIAIALYSSPRQHGVFRNHTYMHLFFNNRRHKIHPYSYPCQWHYADLWLGYRYGSLWFGDIYTKFLSKAQPQPK